MKCSSIQSTDPIAALAEAAEALAQHFYTREERAFLQHFANLLGSLGRLRTPDSIAQVRVARDAVALELVQEQERHRVTIAELGALRKRLETK